MLLDGVDDGSVFGDVPGEAVECAVGSLGVFRPVGDGLSGEDAQAAHVEMVVVELFEGKAEGRVDPVEVELDVGAGRVKHVGLSLFGVGEWVGGVVLVG